MCHPVFFMLVFLWDVDIFIRSIAFESTGVTQTALSAHIDFFLHTIQSFFENWLMSMTIY